MFDKKLIMSLGKLLIAASWADGEMTNDEINSLRDLIYTLPDMKVSDWRIIEVYSDSYVGPSEAKDILDELVSYVQSDDDKELILTTFKKMIEVDGKVTPEEQSMYEDVERIVKGKKIGFFSKLGLISEVVSAGKALRNRSGVTREERAEDFVANRIYFALVTEMETNGYEIEMEEDDIRMICLTAGLMTRVAWVDEKVTDEEFASIVKTLAEKFDLDPEVAEVIAKIAMTKVENGLEYSGLSKVFYANSTRDERIELIRTLFDIAKSSGKLHRGVEEIKSIARTMMLGQKDFIAAKLDMLD